MAKSTDPLIAGLWAALIAAKLPPGGHDTPWDRTATGTRNRFAKAVRQAMPSGAGFDKIPVYATSAVKAPAKPKKKTRR